MRLLRFDLSGSIDASFGLTQDQIDATAPKWEELRERMLAPDDNDDADDAGFLSLPEQQLVAYEATREDSPLGQVFKLANGIHDEIDAVVVIGNRATVLPAQAMMDACCDPYHNELSRGGRGSKPRMYFAGDHLDNDASAALLSRLTRGGYGDAPVESRYAVVVIDESGETLETAVASRQFLSGLECSLGVEPSDRVARRFIPITGEGPLRELATEIGCEEVFRIPSGLQGFHALSPVGLLPAALLGLDCIQLLKGAYDLSEHFKTADFSENRVLQFVAVNQLLAQQSKATRVMNFGSLALASVGRWYEHLFATSVNASDPGEARIVVSDASERSLRRGDTLVHNVVVESWCNDHLGVGNSQRNHDGLNELADKTLPELLESQITTSIETMKACEIPTTSMVLPRIDTHVLGQLFQMLMIATVIEANLRVSESPGSDS